MARPCRGMSAEQQRIVLQYVAQAIVKAVNVVLQARVTSGQPQAQSQEAAGRRSNPWVSRASWPEEHLSRVLLLRA